MSTQQLMVTVYLKGILPVVGGLLVAYAYYDLFGYNFPVSIVDGILFGFVAYRLGPEAPDCSWRTAFRFLAVATFCLALIPIAFGLTFLVVDALGRFPAFVAAILATCVAILFAHNVINKAVRQPTSRDNVLRGEGPGGFVDAAREAHAEAQRRRRNG